MPCPAKDPSEAGRRKAVWKAFLSKLKGISWFVVSFFLKSSSVAHRKLRQWFEVLSADSDPAVPDGTFS